MKQFDARNLSMMFDLYEMTMANGYFEDKKRDRDDYVSFDVFYRNNPDGGGFAIFAGLEQVLDYLENMHFPLKTFPIFGASTCSANPSSSGWKPISSGGMCMPCPKAASSTPMNPC